MGIVHSLWISKLRYGLQLCTKIRLNESEKNQENMKSLQLTQNRMLSAIGGTKIKDKISTSTLLQKYGLLSINQLATKIKMMEGWKIVNNEEYPLSLDPYNAKREENSHHLRTQPNRIFNDTSKLSRSESSFHLDTARLWNNSPSAVRNATSLSMAKSAIDIYCKTLPL